MDQEQPNPPETPKDPAPDTPPPAPADHPAEGKPKATGSRLGRFKIWYVTKKKISLPATILLVIIILGVIPWTRFYIAGLFLKQNFTVQVVDASSGSPVSGATVQTDSIQTKTDGSGKATLLTKVGKRQFSFSKKYYQDRQASLLVPILKQKTTPAIQLTATGRQVKIVVTNLITKKPLSDVLIKVADTSAQTDKTGIALLVLPANLAKATAALSLDGYNSSSANIQISSTTVQENDFTLTPAGKVYFLSKKTGTLNVMKADLDGANPQVVLAGTGTEQTSSSAISQSPDGKYIALLLKRSNADAQPQLYLLSAADDKLLTIDSGNTVFLLQGWMGDKLIYTAQRNDIPAYTPGANKLKSYDATSGKTITLDQSNAAGDANASAFEYFATTVIAKNTVIYAKSWSTSSAGADTSALIADKNNTLNTINADGTNQKSVASYPAADSIQYVQHSAAALYVWDQAQSGDKFYDYSVGGTPQSVGLTSDQFYSSSGSTYLPSANGNQVLWSEKRNGKQTVLSADAAGNNPVTIATGYEAYGWYGDQYVIISADNVLYSASASGQATAVKLSDYQVTGQM